MNAVLILSGYVMAWKIMF